MKNEVLSYVVEKGTVKEMNKFDSAKDLRYLLEFGHLRIWCTDLKRDGNNYIVYKNPNIKAVSVRFLHNPDFCNWTVDQIVTAVLKDIEEEEKDAKLMQKLEEEYLKDNEFLGAVSQD